MEETKEQKERVTMKIDGETVTVHHNTKTSDGDLWFDTTFDFSNVSHGQLLKWAADGRKIAWRASAGIKKLTSKEIREKGLLTVTVDCSKTIERVKHVETPEEKELKAAINAILAGQGGQKLSIADITKRLKEMQATTEDDDMSKGEETA